MSDAIVSHKVYFLPKMRLAPAAWRMGHFMVYMLYVKINK